MTSHYERWIRDRWLASEISSRSRTDLTSRLRSLDPVCGKLSPREVTRTVIRKWWRSIGHHAAGTRRAYLSTVGGYFRWAVEEGLADVDPTEHLPRVKEPRRVPRARSAEEVTRLLAVASNDRDRLIVWLMVELGLRAVEVARLEVGDYDRAAQTMLIRGKGDHERTLPVPLAASAAVDRYRDKIGWQAGPLICSVRNGRDPVIQHTIGQIVTRVMRAAGVKVRSGDGVTPHTLRHTAASDVLDRCNNVRTVQAMLGHASLATTQIYLRRASIDQLREAMEGRDYGRAA